MLGEVLSHQNTFGESTPPDPPRWLSQWRSSPLAIQLQMSAERPTDPLTHSVLDEHENQKQYCGLSLSLRGLLGNNFRDNSNMWKNGRKTHALPPLSVRNVLGTETQMKCTSDVALSCRIRRIVLGQQQADASLHCWSLQGVYSQIRP